MVRRDYMEDFEEAASEAERDADIASRMWKWVRNSILGSLIFALTIVLVLSLVAGLILLLMVVSGPVVAFLVQSAKLLGKRLLAFVVGKIAGVINAVV